MFTMQWKLQMGVFKIEAFGWFWKWELEIMGVALTMQSKIANGYCSKLKIWVILQGI